MSFNAITMRGIMRYPWWIVWVNPEDHGGLRRMFKALLSDLPMSQDQLAAALQVDQSTVSRWVSGKSLPSTKQMREMVRLVQAHIAEIQERMERTTRFLDAIETVFDQNGPGGIAAIRQVHELLNQWAPRRRPTKRKVGPKRRSREPARG
jgi:transcriptional regulator with XRE-family HTH domain